MISKKTFERNKEIDFEIIINNNGLIKHLVLHSQDCGGTRKDNFLAAAGVYYCHLLDIPLVDEILNKDSYFIAWLNLCITEDTTIQKGIAKMLAGIYQFIEWDKENDLKENC